MVNKITRIDFNKEKLYEALRMNGINSIRDLCDTNDSLCYGGNYVSRKTIERACQTGKVSVRTLEILSRALDCTPEFFTSPDVVVKEETDQCVVYLSDGRECTIKGSNLYWSEHKDFNDRYIYRFLAEEDDGTGVYTVAEFFTDCVMGIVRVEV